MPVFVVELTVRVSVDTVLPLGVGVAGLGENVAETPVGRPVAVRATGDWKSLREPTVMARDPDVPLTMVREVEDADREKSGGGFTVRIIVRD